MIGLLCCGDIAINEELVLGKQWLPPISTIPDFETKILFNWELPISETVNSTPRTRGPRLLSHPGSVQVIEKWAPGFAALATNHILDAGEEGLEKTIAILKEMDFQTVGAGISSDEINRPLIWETDEGRLAIVNWVFSETHPDWDSIPGPNCWPGVEIAEKIIRNLKDNSDWVLVFAHWSDELFPYPRPEDRRIAQLLALSGADIVIGHHPHVVRGMELIGTCPVFYSLGNFYFSDFPNPKGGWIVKQAPRNRESLGVLLSFQRGIKPRYQVISYWNAPKLTRLDSHRRAARRMKQVSRPLIEFPPFEYKDWYQTKRIQFNRGEIRWHFGVRRLGTVGFVQYLLRRLQT